MHDSKCDQGLCDLMNGIQLRSASMLRLFLDRDEDGRVLRNVAKVSECRSDKFGESGLKAKTLSPKPVKPTAQ